MDSIVGSYDSDEFRQEFFAYCDGNNNDFIHKIKLESPEQVKIINDYNKVVDKINHIYKKYETMQMQHDNTSEKEKQNRYNVLKERYNISKSKNENQQDLNR